MQYFLSATGPRKESVFISPSVMFAQKTLKLGINLHSHSRENYFGGLSLSCYSAVVWIKYSEYNTKSLEPPTVKHQAK